MFTKNDNFSTRDVINSQKAQIVPLIELKNSLHFWSDFDSAEPEP